MLAVSNTTPTQSSPTASMSRRISKEVISSWVSMLRCTPFARAAGASFFRTFSIAVSCSSQVTSVRNRSTASRPRYAGLKLPGETQSSKQPIAAFASIMRVNPAMMSPSPAARSSGASALQ